MKASNNIAGSNEYDIRQFHKITSIVFFLSSSVIFIVALIVGIHDNILYIVYAFPIWATSIYTLRRAYIYKIRLGKDYIEIYNIFGRKRIHYKDVRKIMISSHFTMIVIESKAGKVKILSEVNNHMQLKVNIINAIIAVNPKAMLDGYVSTYEKYKSEFGKDAE